MAGRTTTLVRERTVRVGQRREVVIPNDILKTLRLRTGDMVAFGKHRNGVLLKSKRAVDPDDALTPEEAKVVRRGEAQLRRGKGESWSAVRDALSL